MIDMEFYKKNPNKKRTAVSNQRNSLQPKNNMNITIDMNDSYIFKESPDKIMEVQSVASVKSKKSVKPFMP
jgi:hypothetical protein